ncbi:MAG TPA: bifunctional nuclease family protein [Polyangiaceae bacterium]|jgi:bifunctional DNase/RNase
MARRKMVPILIGDSEAMSIQRRLEQRQAGKNSEARRGLAKPNPSWFERSGVESSPTPPPSGPVRPLTHDLLDSMVTRLGGQIHSVRVERLDHGVFYGIVVLKTRGTLVEFDARSSDAVALAVGNGVPIFMAQSVLDQAGMGLPESPPSPGEESVAL